MTSRGPDGREWRDSWRLDSMCPHSDRSKEQQEDYDSQKPRIYFINFLWKEIDGYKHKVIIRTCIY